MTIAADIEAVAPCEPRLRFIHITQVSAFREICQVGSIQCAYCPVMKHNITYFFYGRPAYRPGPSGVTNRNRDLRPVCMLFNASMITIEGVYPFDTGAHQRSLYSPYMDGISFPDLECSRVRHAEQRIVMRYFETNEEYFYGAAKDTLTPPPTSPVAQAYHRLLTATGNRPHDDRCLTIEIQSSIDVTIDHTLAAIVFPDFLNEDPQIRDRIDTWETEGVVVHPYRPQTVSSAAQTVDSLFPTILKLQEA
jgi:hypothetical protein